MGLIKCTVCPNRGKFESGKYYDWVYSGIEQMAEESDLSVRDMNGTRICFSANEVNRFFRKIHYSHTDIQIYIDRKKELILVPVFKHEVGYHVTLDYFYRVSIPYIDEDIGEMFHKVWEEHKNHEVVTAKVSEQTTPFFKIVMKGKGWPSFTSGRWMIHAQFILSENEVILTYWYKKKGNSYGNNSDDRIIERILSMSASDKEIGSSIIAIFQEARII